MEYFKYIDRVNIIGTHLNTMNSTMSADSTALNQNSTAFAVPVFSLNTNTSSFSSGIGAYNSSAISGVETTLKGHGKDSQYGPEFLERVKQIAQRINCDYKDLLAVMNSESGIRADAVNPNGGATGLIQFMPSTARSLGTTTAALRAMSPVEQLDYVEKYLVNCKKSAGIANSKRLSAGDLYTLIFLPGRANREVLTTAGEAYYNANKGADTNHDGKITKSELSARVASKHVNENTFLA